MVEINSKIKKIIEENPLSFATVDNTGNAEYFTSGKWKTFVEKMSENKGLPAKGAILISVSGLIKLK